MIQPITSVDVHSIYDSTGIEKSIIRKMMEGNLNRIRDLDNPGNQLSLKIPIVAVNNGVFKDIPVTLVGEIGVMILEQFSHISLDEIDLAYRLYAGGKLQVQGSADTFGGTFSLRQIGKILSAYDEQRRKVFYEFGKLNEGRKNIKTKEELLREFEEGLLENIQTFEKDWRYIPLGFYYGAARLGLFEQTIKEKRELMVESRNIVLTGDDEVTFGNPIEELEPNKKSLFKKEPRHIREIQVLTEESIISKSKNVARRLTLWRKIIIPYRKSITENG